MNIDAHQHYWNYSPNKYPWITEQMATIRRNFLPDDICGEAAAAGLTGVIAVQARQRQLETDWLLDLAAQNEFIRGVVGWVDLRDRAIAGKLERLSRNPKLKGVRHVVQDEPDERFLQRSDFNRGIRALLRHSLVYDILIHSWQLPRVIEFVDRHPNQLFVLDHLAKPPIRDGGIKSWARNLRRLGRRPNVYAKISGLATEAAPHSQGTEHLRPYMDQALEIFGPRRLMFGSDWPVCLLATSYRQWLHVVANWVTRLSAVEQRRILGATAAEVYGL